MSCETKFSIGDRVRVVDVVEKGFRDNDIGKVGILGTVTFNEEGVRFYVRFENDTSNGVIASDIQPVGLSPL
jgi:hypothetical protein